MAPVPSGGRAAGHDVLGRGDGRVFPHLALLKHCLIWTFFTPVPDLLSPTNAVLFPCGERGAAGGGSWARAVALRHAMSCADGERRVPLDGAEEPQVLLMSQRLLGCFLVMKMADLGLETPSAKNFLLVLQCIFPDAGD